MPKPENALPPKRSAALKANYQAGLDALAGPGKKPRKA